VRCAAVAAGREAYERVLAEPSKLRRFARKEAEHLLTVAQDAYERSSCTSTSSHPPSATTPPGARGGRRPGSRTAC